MSSEATPPPPTYPVLIVDDDRSTRTLLQALLESQGYRAIQAADGATAIEIVKTQPVGLVILDMMMIGLDGPEVCAHLRAQANLPHLPVIMVSGLADRASRIRAKEAGADDYLVKPVDTLELLIRVEALHRNRDTLERLGKRVKTLEALVDQFRADLAARDQRLLEAQQTIVELRAHRASAKASSADSH